MFRKFFLLLLVTVAAGACAPTYNSDVTAPQRSWFDHHPHLNLLNYDRSGYAVTFKFNGEELLLANGKSAKVQLRAPILSSCRRSVSVSRRGAGVSRARCRTPERTYLVEASIYTRDNRLRCRASREFRVIGEGRSDYKELKWEIRSLPCDR